LTVIKTGGDTQTLSGGDLTNFDARLIKLLGRSLPSACDVSTGYAGKPRWIVPTVRTIANCGESLQLKIIALDRQPAQSVAVHLRCLGSGEWQSIEAHHDARAVYFALLPAASRDFEYFVEARTSDGRTQRWPASAPEINQTVVVNQEMRDRNQ
jgi:hypothetical protein